MVMVCQQEQCITLRNLREESIVMLLSMFTNVMANEFQAIDGNNNSNSKTDHISTNLVCESCVRDKLVSTSGFTE